MKITGNEPAMPQPMVENDGRVYNTLENYNGEFGGLTIRQQLAMASDIPWNSCVDALYKKNSGINPTNQEVIEYRASLQVLSADALIAELNKSTSNTPEA